MENDNTYNEDDNKIVREFTLTPDSLSNVEVDGKESTLRSLDVATLSSPIDSISHPNYRSVAIEGPIESQTFNFQPSSMVPPDQFGSVSRPKEYIFQMESPSFDRSTIPVGMDLKQPKEVILSTVEVSSPSTTAISQVDNLPPPPSYRPLHKLFFKLPSNSFNNTLDFLQSVHHTLFDLGLDSNFIPAHCLWEVCVVREGKFVEWKMRSYNQIKEDQENSSVFILEFQRISGSTLMLNKFHSQIKKRLQLITGKNSSNSSDSSDDNIEEEILLEPLSLQQSSSGTLEEIIGGDESIVLSIPSLTHHSSSTSTTTSSSNTTNTTGSGPGSTPILSPPPLDLSSQTTTDFQLPPLSLDQVNDSLLMFSEMVGSNCQDQILSAASSLSCLLSSASEMDLGQWVRGGVVQLLMSLLSMKGKSHMIHQFAVISIARLSEFDHFHEHLISQPCLLSHMIPLAQEGSFRENEMRREASRCLANLCSVFTQSFVSTLFSLAQGRNLLINWLSIHNSQNQNQSTSSSSSSLSNTSNNANNNNSKNMRSHTSLNENDEWKDERIKMSNMRSYQILQSYL